MLLPLRGNAKKDGWSQNRCTVIELLHHHRNFHHRITQSDCSIKVLESSTLKCVDFLHILKYQVLDSSTLKRRGIYEDVLI